MWTCLTDELKSERVMHGPLAQWPKPMVRDMPSRDGMMSAAAPPAERIVIAIARPTDIALLKGLLRPVD
jgi:hypothetical protein